MSSYFAIGLVCFLGLKYQDPKLRSVKKLFSPYLFPVCTEAVPFFLRLFSVRNLFFFCKYPLSWELGSQAFLAYYSAVACTSHNFPVCNFPSLYDTNASNRLFEPNARISRG